jgi:hypothetical protein
MKQDNYIGLCPEGTVMGARGVRQCRCGAQVRVIAEWDSFDGVSSAGVLVWVAIGHDCIEYLAGRIRQLEMRSRA